MILAHGPDGATPPTPWAGEGGHEPARVGVGRGGWLWAGEGGSARLLPRPSRGLAGPEGPERGGQGVFDGDRGAAVFLAERRPDQGAHADVAAVLVLAEFLGAR